VGAAGEETSGAFVPVVVPWEIELSEDLAPILRDGGGAGFERLGTRSEELRTLVFAELGVPLPSPRLRIRRELPPRHARIILFEVPSRTVRVPSDEADPASFIADHALAILRARAADFLGLAETQRLLDELEQVSAAVVRSVVPKPIPLTLLTDVLRRLVEEQVGVRDLRGVLEALALVGATEKDPLALTEHVRAQLRRPITFRLTAGASTLAVYLLDPMIEDTIRRAVTRTASGAFLTLPPASARDVVASIARAFGEVPPPPGAPRVVLTQPDIRRFVRKLIDTDLPETEVVSFAELLPEVNLRPLARANLVGL
jgi:type III secretion protein V